MLLPQHCPLQPLCPSLARSHIPHTAGPHGPFPLRAPLGSPPTPEATPQPLIPNTPTPPGPRPDPQTSHIPHPPSPDPQPPRTSQTPHTPLFPLCRTRSRSRARLGLLPALQNPLSALSEHPPNPPQGLFPPLKAPRASSQPPPTSQSPLPLPPGHGSPPCEAPVPFPKPYPTPVPPPAARAEQARPPPPPRNSRQATPSSATGLHPRHQATPLSATGTRPCRQTTPSSRCPHPPVWAGHAPRPSSPAALSGCGKATPLP